MTPEGGGGGTKTKEKKQAIETICAISNVNDIILERPKQGKHHDNAELYITDRLYQYMLSLHTAIYTFLSV